MFTPGSTEILIILGVIAAIFGAKKLPEIGKQLGRVGSEFKTGHKEGLGQLDSAQDESDDQVADPKSDDGLNIEAELKKQVMNRLPGVGQINKIKRTAQVATKVMDSVGDKGEAKPKDKG